MPRRTTLISLLGIALFAVPLSSSAESGNVSSTQNGPAIERAAAASQSKKAQSLKPNGRLKGTVEYKMEHGNGTGVSEGQAENVQAADHPENWVEVGQNSRGIIRIGPPDQPVISNGQIHLKLLEGYKLPPTDIGNPVITYPNNDIYGNDVIYGEPPYESFQKIDSKPSGLSFEHGPQKNIDRRTEIKLEEIKPTTNKINATTGDVGINRSGDWWTESNTSEPAK
jgi:hypothetical protein